MTGTTPKLGIEITTELKRSVESFQRLQKSLADSQVAFAEAQAKAGQLKAELKRRLPPLKALEKEYQAAERSTARFQRQIMAGWKLASLNHGCISNGTQPSAP